MTWSNDPSVVRPIVGMMMGSREAVVNYMTPLGLAHLMGTNHHYGPAPWVNDLDRQEWNPAYYHRADLAGIGFDRTASGSNAVAQYSPVLAREFADVQQTPEKYLLWFHHLPWDLRMKSGLTLWDELVRHYDAGVEQVAAMRRTWAGLKGKVDAARYAAVEANLGTQAREARWWRDACIAYFQSISKRPLPPGSAPPQHPLSYYEALRFTNVPGTPH
jgi:alpha-glucuronidase